MGRNWGIFVADDRITALERDIRDFSARDDIIEKMRKCSLKRIANDRARFDPEDTTGCYMPPASVRNPNFCGCARVLVEEDKRADQEFRDGRWLDDELAATSQSIETAWCITLGAALCYIARRV